MSYILQQKLDILYTSQINTYCQSLATGRWFSPWTPVSSTNKIDRHDITEILLKVALSTL
jgi:hypothetical protein